MLTINQNLIDDFADKINEKEKKNNKVTSLSSSSTHVQYPSAKAVYDAISEVEASSSGNYIYDFYHDSSTDDIVLEYDSASGGGSGGGSSVDIVTSWEQTLSNEKVPSEKLVKDSLDLKSDSTHTHNQYLTEHQSLANYVQKETGKGLFSGSYADLTNKPSYSPIITSSTSGAYKIGSINISGSNVDIYGKDTDTHQSLTNYVQKSSTNGLLKNDGSVDTSSYLTSHQTLKTINNESLVGSGNITITGGGNGFSGDYADLTNKPSYTPTITSSSTGAYKIGSINISGSSVDIYGKDTDTQPPSASTTTPSADTLSGNYGSGTTYARANHSHPRSSLYAETSHNHNYSDVNNVSYVTATITYTDQTTQTVKLLKYDGS